MDGCEGRRRPLLESAGSTTYGWEFGNVIQYKYPGDDYKDLMAGVDELVARGWVDARRMGVTGGSGGGLLTKLGDHAHGPV
jgi:dipeptidyl aminopeptidase/acylaminoacyl peptidase